MTTITNKLANGKHKEVKGLAGESRRSLVGARHWPATLLGGRRWALQGCIFDRRNGRVTVESYRFIYIGIASGVST